MTLKADIEAKIAALKAEIAILEAHVASGGSWLDQEITVVEEFVKNIVARVRDQPPVQ